MPADQEERPAASADIAAILAEREKLTARADVAALRAEWEKVAAKTDANGLGVEIQRRDAEVASLKKAIHAPGRTPPGQPPSAPPPPQEVGKPPAGLDAAGRQRLHDYLDLADCLARTQFRRCGRKVPLDELAGEARLALVYAAGLFDEGRGVPFGAYVTMVVRHWLVQAVTRWRRRGRLDHVCFTELSSPDAADERSPFDPPCPRGQNPAQEAADREVVDRVRRSMPPRWFALLRLYFVEEHTLEEIGVQIGVSRERVRQLLAKALRRARRHCPRKVGGSSEG
jgi:RNA polymerase sigma factor (sigma-70 family)